WERLDAGLLVDVREPGEFEAGHLAGAINLPLSQLRVRHGELPRDREVTVYCQVGQRGYYATRFLRQHGVAASNFSGGFTTWKALRGAGLVGEGA
ncbi:MAG: rhodanese-like domain-containing protein, partial [Alphaproteobacteria bacterium]